MYPLRNMKIFGFFFRNSVPQETMKDIDRLKELLIGRSVKIGNFILASGKSSNVYVDARLTTMRNPGIPPGFPERIEVCHESAF